VHCSRLKLPNGATAIICGPKPRFPRCKFCHGSQPATQLCDFEIGKTLGGDPLTCDENICVHCARRVGDKDFCPKHSK
jgi:hypothetical protein